MISNALKFPQQKLTKNMLATD